MTNRWLQALLLTLFALLAIIPMIVIHEYGHVLLARLFGASDARFILYQRHEGGRIIGMTIYNSSAFSPMQMAFVKVGGILFTQTVAVLALVLWGMLGQWFLRRLAAALAILFFFDLPWQVGKAVVADVQGQTGMRGTDLADLLFILHGEWGLSITLMKVGLVLFLLMYVLLAGVMFFSWRRRRGEAGRSAEQHRLTPGRAQQ